MNDFIDSLLIVQTMVQMVGSHYKYALIDDVEAVLQTVLGNGLQLRGYVEEV